MFFFFFFQAEDGIRDGTVTGVQTCALPISVDGASAHVRIWNPDGSTAELSGNGARIVAAWLAQRSGEEHVTVRVGERDTKAEVRDAQIVLDLGHVQVDAPERIDLG